MTDYNKIADELQSGVRHSLQPENQTTLDAAIDLCRRMAAGELVDRREVVDVTLECKRRLRWCTCGQQSTDPDCTARIHD